MMANRGKGDFEDIESLLKEYSAIYNGFQSLETSDSPSNSQQYQVCLHHVHSTDSKHSLSFFSLSSLSVFPIISYYWHA